ncbi:MAG TPA: hypothetical protein V6D47_09000 [Oscillatoriaceae cyanobacterium]
MGSSVQYSLLSGLRAISAWQQNIARNVTGLLQPGYNLQDLNFDGSPNADTSASRTPTQSTGGRSATSGGADTLFVGSTQINFQPGDILPADSPTSLAVNGQGFFLVAENLRPGARVFLTRAGNFHYDASGRLVNEQGLFVVGNSGRLTDPPTPILNPGDGTVPLGQLSLARVAVPANLQPSGYGSAIYSLPTSAGPLQVFQNGSAQVGFVQTNSLEFAPRIGLQNELTVEMTESQQAYTMFKNMLDTYNKAVDDAISLVH